MGEVITIEDVREDMMDRKADDHLVLADLAFTDKDIEWAMKTCSRKFNSIKPLVVDANWEALPAGNMAFFDGIAWALIRRWRRNAAMNDVDYSAGGVNARVQGNLVENLSKMQAELEREFVEAAQALKVTINVSDAFGRIG